MRNARGSNQRRMPAVQPEPGPPWRTTAGLAEGLPQLPSTLLAVADSEHPVLVGFDRGKAGEQGISLRAASGLVFDATEDLERPPHTSSPSFSLTATLPSARWSRSWFYPWF